MSPLTPPQTFTRGNGLLESCLARMRARKANALLPDHLRRGRILDIGCGAFPYFLSHTYFKEKFALDQQSNPSQFTDILWSQLDLSKEQSLPYEDGFFDAVTMLAVIEHLNPAHLAEVFRETHRILTPGGRLVITTPAAWSDPVLHWMAHVRLVSKEEIHEHAFAYSLPLLGWHFGNAGFSMENMQLGYFEFGLNMWAFADR